MERKRIQEHIRCFGRTPWLGLVVLAAAVGTYGESRHCCVNMSACRPADVRQWLVGRFDERTHHAPLFAQRPASLERCALSSLDRTGAGLVGLREVSRCKLRDEESVFQCRDKESALLRTKWLRGGACDGRAREECGEHTPAKMAIGKWRSDGVKRLKCDATAQYGREEALGDASLGDEQSTADRAHGWDMGAQAVHRGGELHLRLWTLRHRPHRPRLRLSAQNLPLNALASVIDPPLTCASCAQTARSPR